MTHAFDAFVTAALFDASGRAWFALGDGTVRREDGLTLKAHQGAVLCAAVHPTGAGVLTGGDDGVLAWSRESGVEILETIPGRWIDAVTASPASGLNAWASGQRVEVRDVETWCVTYGEGWCFFFFFSSRRRHTSVALVSWARRCV